MPPSSSRTAQPSSMSASNAASCSASFLLEPQQGRNDLPSISTPTSRLKKSDPDLEAFCVVRALFIEHGVDRRMTARLLGMLLQHGFEILMMSRFLGHVNHLAKFLKYEGSRRIESTLQKRGTDQRFEDCSTNRRRHRRSRHHPLAHFKKAGEIETIRHLGA